eukprot:Amastigsp_a841028_1370.p3 type:complete len:155 gc:universal Amastigsp_a841028_1370:1413-949(-)
MARGFCGLGACAERRGVPQVLQGDLLPAHLRDAAADARAEVRVVQRVPRSLRLPAGHQVRERAACGGAPNSARVVLGHHRRVHLPVPVVLPVPPQGAESQRRRARHAHCQPRRVVRQGGVLVASRADGQGQHPRRPRPRARRHGPCALDLGARL